MNAKTEDFPTPVSPTIRMVYGAFALFFDILMTPLLRDSTSLANTVRTIALKTVTYLMVRAKPSSSASKVFSNAPGNVYLEGTSLLNRLPKLLAINGSGLHGKTHGLGMTRGIVDIVRMMIYLSDTTDGPMSRMLIFKDKNTRFSCAAFGRCDGFNGP
jgi:hypothetical protein